MPGRQSADLAGPIKFGFYGCEGRVVKVVYRHRRTPTAKRIKCPACGHRHIVEPMWRNARPLETIASAEAEL